MVDRKQFWSTSDCIFIIGSINRYNSIINKTTSKMSRGVAPGGVMSLPKASYSKETQEMLKLMMAESKLTNFQQRKLQETLKGGGSLPLRCNPTSSGDGPTRVKCKARRNTRSKEHKSGLRSKDTIDVMQQSQKDDCEGIYMPTKTGYNSDKEKARLQNRMAFGQDCAPSVPAKSKPSDTNDDDIDRFEEVLKEIEERREFLSEMEAIGKDKEYRNKIQTEISQKIRELKDIDKQRCLEIQELAT